MTPLASIYSSPSKKVPLLIEVPIPPGLDGPFLISSMKSYLWIDEQFSPGVVRAAVRKAPAEFLFREAVEKVAEKSKALSWGSLNTPSKEGVLSAIGHLSSYGLVSIEVLYGEGFDLGLIPEGTPSSEEVWVPAGWALVLPKDKSFVGTLFDFGQSRKALVIHNASRGIGLVIPEGI